MQHAYKLVVLTLLQLCRAEIPEALPEWYAANLINDSGYPKPITEIFTTPETFSSKNPIIVTSTTFSSDTEEMFSTSPTSTTTETTRYELTRPSEDTTRRVIPLREDRPSSSQPRDLPSQAYQPQQENRPTSSQPLNIPVQMNESPPQREDFASSSQPLDTSRQMYQPPPQREIHSTPSQPLDMPRQMYQPPPQQIQVLVAPPQIQTSQQVQPSLQVPPSSIPPSPQLSPVPSPPCPQLPPAPVPPSPQIQFPMQPVNSQTTGQPNYFLIYQQAPLSIQQYPESASQSRQNSPSTSQTTTQTAETQRTTREATRPTTAQPPSTTEETQTTQLSTTHTLTSHSTSAPRNIRQEQIAYWQELSAAPVARNFNPPIGSSIFPGAFHIPCFNASTPGKIATTPSAMTSSQRQSGKSGLTIRVTAPRGSITNIKINPSTTTKKPATRRSQRRKGNNYNNCVESCKGKKEPLCAAPLAVLPIDPNNLRGFPSICHLACHNSFRKNQPYEKVMDGRCSRLRTRIRTFDQNKLKREELNKAQYTVLNNIPETIVQVIQNERSGVY